MGTVFPQAPAAVDLAEILSDGIFFYTQMHQHGV